ncbi:MAG TPA: SMP-30/gluconolactonase/LRE family protein [Anaeromyxobacteraceae bacterium]|nr:SMP-30/gluconolactonase/LRE family protein [Anaeromyxobacteraceae bacterium]
MNPKKLLALAALAAATGCAGAAKRPDVVWPPPPDLARIKFVTAFASEHDIDTSGWSQFKRALIGEKDPTRVNKPMGIALSKDGNRLYVADFEGSQILLIDFPTKTMKPFAPKEGFAMPFNVVLDAEENVYVSDSGARTVSRFDREGKRVWQITDDLVRPTGLALDQKRQILYVTDSARQDSQKHRVFAYDLHGKRLRQVGRERGTGDGEFAFPSYLAVDADGNLYVSDTLNFRIQVFDPDGNLIRAFGEHGDQPGMFTRTKGIAFDAFRNVYVADGGPSVVHVFSKDFQPLMFFGGFAPLLEYFDIPSCIAIDQARNRIYVCNEHNARINVYDLINTKAEDAATPPPAPAAAGAPEVAK